MKAKIYFCIFTLAIGISSYATKKANSAQSHNIISLSSIRTLSDGEDTGLNTGENGSENEGPCKTITNTSIEFQDCNGYQKMKRLIFNNKCTGKSLGSCLEGNEYYFYDCDGVKVGYNDYTSITVCF